MDISEGLLCTPVDGWMVVGVPQLSTGHQAGQNTCQDLLLLLEQMVERILRPGLDGLKIQTQAQVLIDLHPRGTADIRIAEHPAEHGHQHFQRIRRFESLDQMPAQILAEEEVPDVVVIEFQRAEVAPIFPVGAQDAGLPHPRRGQIPQIALCNGLHDLPVVEVVALLGCVAEHAEGDGLHHPVIDGAAAFIHQGGGLGIVHAL